MVTTMENEEVREEWDASKRVLSFKQNIHL